jgi:type I restriction-modification system DNA methylase subunit
MASDNDSKVVIVQELIKSRKRIADHGEVFTPSWMVEDMLNLVQTESQRIDSRFLEPACGSGNFLCAVLLKKLETVQKRYGSSEFEKRHNALFSLMCIYGIELLEDNIIECKENLMGIFIDYLELGKTDVLISAAKSVLDANIIQGDALTLNDSALKAIEFPEWGYLGKGKYQRRDFRFDDLTQRAGIEGTLFELFEEDQLFAAVKTYPQMSVEEIGK